MKIYDRLRPSEQVVHWPSLIPDSTAPAAAAASELRRDPTAPATTCLPLPSLAAAFFSNSSERPRLPRPDLARPPPPPPGPQTAHLHPYRLAALPSSARLGEERGGEAGFREEKIRVMDSSKSHERGIAFTFLLIVPENFYLCSSRSHI